MEVHGERTAAAEEPARFAAAGEDAVVSVRVRYFAGARAAAGVGEETLRVAPGAGGAVGANEVVEAVSAAHEGKLERVLASCSFLLDGVAVRDRTVEVAEGSQFDVLPPFAGG